MWKYHKMTAYHSRALVCDTRQKAGKHDAKEQWWEEQNIPTLRASLPVGDYAWIAPVSVDTKRDLYELAMDLQADHARFKREVVRAKDSGCRLYVLVENKEGVRTLSDLAKWVEPKSHVIMRRRRSGKAAQIHGSQLAKACVTMQDRYGVTFLFCAPEETAQKVIELLGDPKGDQNG